MKPIFSKSPSNIFFVILYLKTHLYRHVTGITLFTVRAVQSETHAHSRSRSKRVTFPYLLVKSFLSAVKMIWCIVLGKCINLEGENIMYGRQNANRTFY